jgi:N-acyl amino acid synthase of PEP-CTERM/exosortase system
LKKTIWSQTVRVSCSATSLPENRFQPTPIHPAGADQAKLLRSYDRHFDVRIAENPEDLKQVHRLRYQVYCVENPFEDPSDHPDGFEADDHDDHSVHALLRHKATGMPIGAVRLILPRLGMLQHSFPMQQICEHPTLSDPTKIPLRRTAEVSRFCLSKSARRYLGDQFANDKELVPYFTLGLIRGLVQLSAENGIRHWCIVVEPALLRFLKRLGLNFETIGPLVDYHGMRQPCHADLDKLLAHCAIVRPDVWSVITRDGSLWPPRPKVHALPLRAVTPILREAASW